MDELCVKVLNIPYNRAVEICFYFFEAPTSEAVKKHHEKYGIECNWITEIQTTA